MIQYQDEYLTVFESALFRTTSTVFHNEDLILLVDPNWLPEEVKTIRQFIDGLKDHRPFYLLFTHSDYDHIIASELFSDAQTIASQAFVDQGDAPKILQQIIDFDQSYYVQRDYPIRYPQIDQVVQADGEQLIIGNTRLTFYHAPGHNTDGIFTFVEPFGLWIAGDYLSNIEFPYIYHSSSAYEETLAKTSLILDRPDFQILVPGHGDIATSREEVLLRKKESLDYIHQLRACIVQAQEFDLAPLWQRYDFPAGMLPFHEGNVKLMEGERRSG